MIVQPYDSISVNTPFPATLFTWPGGDGFITVSGTFNSPAELVVQWADIDGMSLSGDVIAPITAAGVYTFIAPKGKLQCSLNGTGGSVTGLTVAIADKDG